VQPRPPAPSSTTAIKPAPAPKPVETTTKVAPPTAAPSVAKVTPSPAVIGGVAAGGIVISGVALASMKHEQGVHSIKQALEKVGAATPDVVRDGHRSTSYGLFGINNINAKDKNGNYIKNSSSIASLVKSFPEFELPDPGGHNDPAQTKIFNNAWEKLAKSQPEKLLNAQLKWFKMNFEDPAKEKLNKSGISENISSNPSVQKYMIDRKIQVGNTMYESAIAYAKKAKTPEEFMSLVAEHDMKNLRQMFKSTSAVEFERLRKGLENRITNRKNEALNLKPAITSEDIITPSKENKDLKIEVIGHSKSPAPIPVMSGAGTPVKSTSGEPVTAGNTSDDAAYLKKQKANK
jgi:hypothetical protein